MSNTISTAQVYEDLLKLAATEMESELEKHAFGLSGIQRFLGGSGRKATLEVLEGLADGSAVGSPVRARRVASRGQRRPLVRRRDTSVGAGEFDIDVAPAVDGSYGMSLKNKLLGAGAGAGIAGGTGYLMHNNAMKEEKRKRNMAFGAGMASGIAAPGVLKNLTDTVNNLRGNATATTERATAQLGRTLTPNRQYMPSIQYQGIGYY